MKNWNPRISWVSPSCLQAVKSRGWMNVPAMKQDKLSGSSLSQSHPCARPERDPLMSKKLMYCGLWYKATVIDFLFNHKLQLPQHSTAWATDRALLLLRTSCRIHIRYKSEAGTDSLQVNPGTTARIKGARSGHEAAALMKALKGVGEQTPGDTLGPAPDAAVNQSTWTAAQPP